MTGTPDAVVEAAAEAMKRIVPNTDGVLWEFEETMPPHARTSGKQPRSGQPPGLFNGQNRVTSSRIPRIENTVKNTLDATRL